MQRQREQRAPRLPKRQPDTSVNAKDQAALALCTEVAARAWVDAQERTVAVYVAGMRTAKAIFDHAATVRGLTTEYEALTERYRATFSTYRDLYDSGQAALDLLGLADTDVDRGRVCLRRGGVSARVDDVAHTVAWRVGAATESSDGATTSLAAFGTLKSLLDCLYSAQLDQRRVVEWGSITIKTSEGPFRLEQLACAMIDGLTEVLELSRLKLHEVPVVAVAASIDCATGTHSLAALREELRKRADEWRQKPSLLRRRRPLRGRTFYTE